MDSSISIPLDLSGIRLPPIAPSFPLPLVERRPTEEVVAPPVTRAKMQPHFGYAILLTLGLFAVLIGVQMVWGIFAVVVMVFAAVVAIVVVVVAFVLVAVATVVVVCVVPMIVVEPDRSRRLAGRRTRCWSGHR